MTRTKLDTPAFADESVDSRNIADGTIQNQDISGSLTNDKLANSSFTINGSSVSLGASTSIIPFLEWQAVTVADGSTTLTAEAGKGYFLDTNTGVIEVFLPTSPSRGDTIGLVDYSGTFATNKLIINTGGQLIDSTTGSEFKVETNNSIVELVYVDADKGWQVILNQAAGTTPSSALTGFGSSYDTPEPLITATGGTITQVANFRVHAFTGDGTFSISNVSPNSPGKVDYVVVAGGGGGSWAGAGAGGYRTGSCAACTGLPISASPGSYPITVGGGGPGGATAGAGSNSIFSTITSAGGGYGGSFSNDSPQKTGGNGGSGGGGGGNLHATQGSGGSGNTPPVSPPQGNNGAKGSTDQATFTNGGGGGGATQAGSGGNPNPDTSPSPSVGGDGSNAHVPYFGCAPQPFYTTPTGHFAGGGGGTNQSPGSQVCGGAGGGGNGQAPGPTGCGTAGTANTGGGGAHNRAGGKGIVLIRYKYTN